MCGYSWRVILVKNFFRDLGMSRNGSKNRVCAPKNRPIWFFCWSHRILQQKNYLKNKKSWAIVYFKKWAFMILLNYYNHRSMNAKIINRPFWVKWALTLNFNPKTDISTFFELGRFFSSNNENGVKGYFGVKSIFRVNPCLNV